MPDDPWEENDHGLWCPACGYHIAPSWFLNDEDFQPPEICKQCGFPDFEEGTEYFTD